MTDTIHIEMDLTPTQAKYLRRKLRTWVQENEKQYKKTQDPKNLDKAVTLSGILTHVCLALGEDPSDVV